jgi:hypothetical protein
MAGPHPHEHLTLPLVVRSSKRNRSTSRQRPAEYLENLKDRPGHGQKLRDQVDARTEAWKEFLAERQVEGLPELPPGMPLLLRIQDGADIDFLRRAFQFEIVAELEDGFALVASGDDDLQTLRSKLDAFVAGSNNNFAELYELVPDETTEARLTRILSPRLLAGWPNHQDALEYVVQVSVSFGGGLIVPILEPQGGAETDEAYAKRLERHDQKYLDHADPPAPKPQRPAETDAEYEQYLIKHGEKSKLYFQRLDALKDARMQEIEDLISSYDGSVESSFIDEIDSFTFVARISGKALRDFALTYKFLFRLSELESSDVTTTPGEGGSDETMDFSSPNPQAPRIAILDSGIQETHPYIAAAIDTDSSICLASNLQKNETGDLFGHGTRVAGAALFPQGIPAQAIQLPFHIVNIKVLDNQGRIAEEQAQKINSGGQYLQQSVAHLGGLNPPVRILNHSIANASTGFHGPHMSPWAAAIDRISYENDTLIVQAAGNIWANRPQQPERCLTSILASGKEYPDYLLDESSRVSDPGQALNALTVGSVCIEEFRDDFYRSFGGAYEPSAFTTTGPGMWRTIKPDVVVPSGDLARDHSEPPSVLPRAETSLYLPRSTMKGGPLVAADDVGTSYAAPIVALLAAQIEGDYPDLTMQHVRSLIGLSARWPEWCQAAQTPEARHEISRKIGFGIPDFDRAVRSADSSVTFLSPDLESIGPREAHIYRLPIPEEVQELAWNRAVRIEVCLAYTALPRQTRRQHRGYLSTWLDWTSIRRQDQTVDEFIQEVLNLASDDTVSTSGGGPHFPWFLGSRSNIGRVANASRNYGTLQKDWCTVPGRDLPEDFCIAVVGHAGWDKTGTHRAKYALTVSLECDDETIDLYTPLEIAIDDLRVQVQ